MFDFLRSFRAKDDGAVTVDWVVLTAAIVGLSIAVIAIVTEGATNKSSGIGAALSNQGIGVN